MEKRKQT